MQVARESVRTATPWMQLSREEIWSAGAHNWIVGLICPGHQRYWITVYEYVLCMHMDQHVMYRTHCFYQYYTFIWLILIHLIHSYHNCKSQAGSNIPNVLMVSYKLYQSYSIFIILYRSKCTDPFQMSSDNTHTMF